MHKRGLKRAFKWDVYKSSEFETKWNVLLSTETNETRLEGIPHSSMTFSESPGSAIYLISLSRSVIYFLKMSSYVKCLIFVVPSAS